MECCYLEWLTHSSLLAQWCRSWYFVLCWQSCISASIFTLHYFFCFRYLELLSSILIFLHITSWCHHVVE